ncbi:MAG: 1-acyl-sn-glycerol-3-phosphate acyltransferase [Thermoleophilaceae bacterium]|nr:1-acyl-sn-glycerol-3-phosphate acyltransferase [Thermoleophilaceae bacterium]
MKAQAYRDPRPAEYFSRFHERARRRGPGLVYDLIRIVLTPVVAIAFRTRVIDIDRVPAQGAAIIAPNHFSYMDHFFAAVFLRRKVQFMGKSQLFAGPMQWVYSFGGVFPVRRGQRDEEAFRTARAVLERGGLVLMYGEGGRARRERLGRPRPGLGRLALETGMPIVPTAIVGSQRVRHWTRLRFPKVTVHYGEPISFERVEAPSRKQAQEASEAVFRRIEALYRELERGGRRHAVEAAGPLARPPLGERRTGST